MVLPQAVNPYSGQLAPATGTPTAFPDIHATRALLLAHPSNSGVVWVGFDPSGLGNTNGFPLNATGPGVTLEGLSNLSRLLAIADTSGDRVCWIILDPNPSVAS